MQNMKSYRVFIINKFQIKDYLGIDSDSPLALLARVSELLLVALDTVRMLVTKDVPLTGQALVALPTAEMLSMPFLVHRVRVLCTENQLKHKTQNMSGYMFYIHREKY